MKKLTSILLALTLCFSCMATVFADEAAVPTVSEKLEQVENYIYGTAQTGALVGRVDAMEKELFGRTSSGAVMTRVDNIYNAVEGSTTAGTPSLASKLNAVEWQFAPRMSGDAAKTRIENLEQTLNGTTNPKLPLIERLDRLTNQAFPSGSLTTSSVILPKDSLVKVKFMDTISSKTNKAGDPVDFVVDDNVYVGETLVLPKGARGYGTIKKIVPPRIFGRDARIDLEFSHVTAIDGTKVPVYIGDLAKQQAKTAAGAAGASIGGMILFGPVGIVGGAFVKGQSVTIPANSNTYVQVNRDVAINGLVQSTGERIVASNTASSVLTDNVSTEATKVEKEATDKAAKEQTKLEKEAKDKAAKEQTKLEKEAKAKEAAEKAAAEKVAKEKLATEKANLKNAVK